MGSQTCTLSYSTCGSVAAQEMAGMVPMLDTCIVLSRVSTHLRVSAHPLFDDSMVHVYLCYTYKWLVCVSAYPRFLARQFQATMGAYSREYGTPASTGFLCVGDIVELKQL